MNEWIGLQCILLSLPLLSQERWMRLTAVRIPQLVEGVRSFWVLTGGIVQMDERKKALLNLKRGHSLSARSHPLQPFYLVCRYERVHHHIINPNRFSITWIWRKHVRIQIHATIDSSYTCGRLYLSPPPPRFRVYTHWYLMLRDKIIEG